MYEETKSKVYGKCTFYCGVSPNGEVPKKLLRLSVFWKRVF